MKEILYKSNNIKFDIDSIVDKDFQLSINLISADKQTMKDIIFQGSYEYGVLSELSASINNIPIAENNDLIIKCNVEENFDILNLRDISADYSLEVYFIYTLHSVIVVYSSEEPDIICS